MQFRKFSLLVFMSLAVVACPTDDDDPVGDDDDDDDDAGFMIQGTAVDFLAQTPVAEGLCMELLDPTDVALGLAEEPELLTTTTVGADGAYTFTDVVTDSTTGLLQVVQDCDGDASTVLPTATGIAADDYADGEDLADYTALSIDAAFEAGIDGSLTAVGHTGDAIRDSGMMIGFTLDPSTDPATPVGGVTVTCTFGDCGTTYYMDADSADGLFSTGLDVNASTDATAGAVYVVPAAPIANWAADDGGTNEWIDQLGGSQTGYAVIIPLYVDTQ